MKKIRFIVALTLSISILLCCCACSKKQVAEVTNDYEEISNKLSTVSSGIVEENDNYALIWDEANNCIQLREKSTGKLWSTTPLNEDGSYVEDPNDIYSPIDIEYIKRSAYRTIKITGKAGAVKAGKVSAEKIENGIKLTFMFDELFIAIPVKFVLSSKGLNTSVDLKEVVEKVGGGSRIFKISLMPYFSSIKNSDQNYLFVPSGSGALMYTDERGEGIERNYSAKIYGEDPVQEKNESYTNDTSIRLSVFGAKDSVSSICGIVKDSAEKCILSASAGDKAIGYSNIYPTFQIRGYNGTVLDYGGATGKKLVNYYSDEKISSGILSVSYTVSSAEDSGYQFMANTYREYLKEKYSLEKNSQNNLLSLKIYGGLKTKKHIFGLPYYKTEALTTFNETLKIVKQLKDCADSMDIQLVGFGESGIDYGKLAGGFELSKAVGNSKGLAELQKYCSDNKINLHMDYDLLYFNKSGKGFSASSDNCHTANGYPTEIYRYSPSTNDKIKEEGSASILSRLKLDDAVDKMITAANKLGFDAISLASLSSTAYSDFSVEKYQNCSLIAEQVTDSISKIKKNGLNVAVANANDYAASVADKIFDAPSGNGLLDAFDCEIPFYQIVYKGYVDYTSASVNTAVNSKEQILKCIETGSPIQFSLINNYSSEYAFYNHDNLQLMVYENNKDSIKDILSDYGDYLNKVKALSIKEHTVINENVRKTVFEDGTTVYVNYGSTEYKTDSLTVGAMNYKVV